MENLPTHIGSPSAWTGRDLQSRPEDWTLSLTNAHRAELDSALEKVMAATLDFPAVTGAAFPLPTLAPVLDSVRAQLVSGLGFVLIRGLDVSTYSERQAALLFYGLGTHIGKARSQNANGDILGHVRDLGADARDTDTRIYQTNERQTFHTDSSDVVGLLCLCKARHGGDSMLVSAASIYNRFQTECPDLLPYLFDSIATDRRGEIPEGMKPYFEIPVFSWFRGFLTVMYQRQYISSAQRFPDAPRLSDNHIAALDQFDTFANDPDMYLAMCLEPGDMQFVHNHSILHDRTGFEDWPDPQKRRYLLRLWLSVAEDRPLPDVFATRFGSTTIGARGGIIVSD